MSQYIRAGLNWYPKDHIRRVEEKPGASAEDLPITLRIHYLSGGFDEIDRPEEIRRIREYLRARQAE